MGAGNHIGRIGGLAVALGVGAAVFTGHGVAWAEPSDTSGSESSASSSSDASSGDASSTSSDTSTGEKPAAAASDLGASDDDASADDKSDGSAEDKSDADEDATDADADADAPTEQRSDKDSDKDKDSQQQKQDDEATTASNAGQSEDAPQKIEVFDEPESAAVVDEAEEKPAGADEAEQPVAPAVGTETGADTATEPVTQPEADTVPVRQADAEAPQTADPITVALSNLIDAFADPFAGDAPSAPVDSPAEWVLAAAARRELAEASATDEAADAVGLSVVAAQEEEDFVPVRVRVIPVTPLLQPLQQIPIFGPAFVTPIVGVLKAIPFVGDALHPIIGYPLGWTGGSTPRDYRVISSDGTSIYVHFFPSWKLDEYGKAPTILNGPGLSLPGETVPTAEDNPFLPNAVIGMAPLLRNGYNVVTWDPRGEWQSGGVLQINHPSYEGKDMQAIISFIAAQPEARLDSAELLDPRIGMVGASYGGGIQFVTAAIDKRVDAIVPTIAWHDLNDSLLKASAPKTSWGALLSLALLVTGQRANLQTYTAVITALLTGGHLPQHDVDFLNERSPFGLLDQIEAPTLLFQGTVDTLFTLQEAHDNAIMLQDNVEDLKVVWFCGGHGACLSSYNDGKLIEDRTLRWLDKYVMGLNVDTGRRFEWVDQNGDQYASDDYLPATGEALVATAADRQRLPLALLFGGSGPNWRAFETGPINGLLGFLSASYAPLAAEARATAAQTTYLVGAPTLTFTYSGRGVINHLYAQLVDDETGLVLGNQVTPIAVTLDGQQREVEIPLEMIAHTLQPGQSVTLQIVGSAVEYQAFWASGEVNISNIELSLPTAAAGAVIPVNARVIAA